MPTHTRSQALEELSVLAQEISSLHLELAELYAAEHRIKTESWFNSDAQYISERDRIADFNALDLTSETMKLTGQLRAAEAKRDYYQLVVHWGASI